MTAYLNDPAAGDVLRSAGLFGFLLYVCLYAGLALRRLSGDGLAYLGGNTLAACCVLAGLAHDFNLAAALVQVFWIVIGSTGIALRLWLRRAGRVRFASDLGG